MKTFATITNIGYGKLVSVDEKGRVHERSTRMARPGNTIQWMPERADGNPVTAIGKGGAVLCFDSRPDRMAKEFAKTFSATFCADEDVLLKEVEAAIREVTHA